MLFLFLLFFFAVHFLLFEMQPAPYKWNDGRFQFLILYRFGVCGSYSEILIIKQKCDPQKFKKGIKINVFLYQSLKMFGYMGRKHGSKPITILLFSLREDLYFLPCSAKIPFLKFVTLHNMVQQTLMKLGFEAALVCADRILKTIHV
jgi:hypothetical protein